LFQPIFAWVISVVIGLEKFSWIKLLGVGIAVIGAVVMAGLRELWEAFQPQNSQQEQKSLDLLIGIIVLLISSFMLTMYLLIQKPLLHLYPPLTLTCWAYISGTIQAAVAALYYVPWTPKWALRYPPAETWLIPGAAWPALIFAVLVNSVLKYGLKSYCNKRANVTLILVWGTLAPLITAGLSWAMSLEKLGFKHLAGFAVIAGVIIVNSVPTPALKTDLVWPAVDKRGCQAWLIRLKRKFQKFMLKFLCRIEVRDSHELEEIQPAPQEIEMQTIPTFHEEEIGSEFERADDETGNNPTSPADGSDQTLEGRVVVVDDVDVDTMHSNWSMPTKK